MSWAERLVQCLKDSNISLIAFVPDVSIGQVTRLIEDDPFFHLVYASREEEAIGIAVGAYAAGRNSAVFMQSSGFGNCINAVGSLCIPHRLPIPFFINLRGDLGDFNIAQVAMGRATRPILDTLGISPLHPDRRAQHGEDLSRARSSSATASREPVAVCLTPMLHGGKIA